MLKKLETFEPRPGIAYLLITCATFLWGLSIVIGRGVHQEIPPLGLSFWRWFVGAVFLLPFVCAELIRKAEIIRRHAKFIIFMGIIQIGSSVMLMVGVNFTTAINASVINAVQPAVTAVAAWSLTKDKLTQGQSAGIVAGFAGILVIVAKADISLLLGFDVNIGDGFAVLAIIGWSIYAALLHRLPKELGVTTTLFLILMAGSLSVLAFYVFETLTVRPVPATINSVIVFLVMGLIISVLSIYIWNSGLRAVGPNRASIFLNLIPIFGAILAISFIGEQLFLYHFIGGALVALGITLVITQSSRKTAP